MAPPRHRRPGFSRKAQYGLFATYVFAIAGAFFAALLLIISIIDPKGFQALRIIGTEITAPVARFFNSIRRTANDAGNNMSAYLDAASKNADLTRQSARNETALIEAKAIKLENKKLRALLQLDQDEPQKIAIGYLISSSASSGRRLATLSIGSASGVAAGQPVRAPEGLIGRVLEVGPTTARVLMITDADNVVPVVRVADGTPALSTGMANGTLAIRAVNLGVNPFKVGDIIVTSGNGGLYLPNIPFAVVTRATRDGAEARPLADPARSSYVMVLSIFQSKAVSAQGTELQSAQKARE